MTPGARREALVPGSLWRHYKKRTLYEVVTLAKLEATEALAVVYRKAGDERAQAWVRPVEDFLAVLPGGVERFAREEHDALSCPGGAHKHFDRPQSVCELGPRVQLRRGLADIVCTHLLSRCRVEGCWVKQGSISEPYCEEHR